MWDTGAFRRQGKGLLATLRSHQAAVAAVTKVEYAMCGAAKDREHIEQETTYVGGRGACRSSVNSLGNAASPMSPHNIHHHRSAPPTLFPFLQRDNRETWTFPTTSSLWTG